MHEFGRNRNCAMLVHLCKSIAVDQTANTVQRCEFHLNNNIVNRNENENENEC